MPCKPPPISWEDAALALGNAQIDYQIDHSGEHFLVQGPNCLIDFWPGTGKWHSRHDVQGYGIEGLIDYIKEEKK